MTAGPDFSPVRTRAGAALYGRYTGLVRGVSAAGNRLVTVRVFVQGYFL